ncbi:MAG TPA: M23 family metallopeptidase [Nevskia sp.]|jgi:murein DD-endopeptidase MepM/ murein hydrolase activator NlpD|nr:M23 family metallopeptidase [Nevskia sp.]
MDIILVSHARGRTWRLRLEPRLILSWLPLAFCALVLVAVCFSAGWMLRPSGGLLPANVVSQWDSQIQAQRGELQAARAKAEEDANALSRRIAELQAKLMRLEAAGSRMTQIAHIDPSEFNFDKAPPMGGPEVQPQTPAVMADVIDSLDQLQQQLSDRERQMRVLEDLLLASRLQKEVRPSGWPIASGYITSPYGMRTDPFTGLRDYHPGIDFAAAEGSQVQSVAAGIVTAAGERSGYGNLVEIDHGNGYVTRYGHNEKILVKVGDRVRKGQAISLIGSTGRSTGPHVHFEVVLNGTVVNPEQYIEAAR